MDDKKDRKSGWKKVWEIAQTLGAGAGVVALQQVLQAAGEKAGKAAGKKIEEALGLTADAAGKTFDDEILFEKALSESGLTEQEKSCVKQFLLDLRVNDKRLAQEFTRWVHNALVKLGKPVPISGGKKGEGPLTYTDYTDGIRLTSSLFKDVANALDEESRKKVLDMRDIRVVPKKPIPGIQFAQQKIQNLTEDQQKNARSLNRTSRQFANWARELRDKQRR